MTAMDLTELPVHMTPKFLRGALVAEIPAGLQLARFNGKVEVGAFSYFNTETVIYHAKIGRYVSCAHRVMIAPTEHPTDWMTTHPFAFGDKGLLRGAVEQDAILSTGTFNRHGEPAIIGHDVWIGYGCFIRQGITIGNGAVIAAGSMVVKDIPPYAIAAGSPAKVKRMRFTDSIVERFQDVEWWNYDLSSTLLRNIDYSNPHAALDMLESTKDQLLPLAPKTLKFISIKGRMVVTEI